MSGLAGLFNIPASDEELLQWSFVHAAQHLEISNAIYARTLIVLPQFLLDPFDPKNRSSMETWAYQHQLMHNNQNQILGIEGFDLTDVNWQDQEERAAWISLNANEHVQASNILELD